MNTDPTPPDPTAEGEPDDDAARGRASCRLRRSYGPPYAFAPAQGDGGKSAGPRTRARGDQPDVGHQKTLADGETKAETTSNRLPAPPPFPDRAPRRRTREPRERVRKTTTRLSDTEYAEIATAARQRAVTVARFLATAGVAAARGTTATAHSDGDRLDVAIDELAALRTALARIGNNLNQIARATNTDGQLRPGEPDHAILHLLRLLVRLDAAADALAKKKHG